MQKHKTIKKLHKTIKKFIIGHKYIYLGIKRPTTEDSFIPRWSEYGSMDFALLPQVLTCTGNKRRDGWPSQAKLCASFHEDKSGKAWTWGNDIENWIDVTDMPEKDIQKILANKRKLMVAEKI